MGVALAVIPSWAGCDVQEDANVERGRDLFIAKCSQCHALAEAGATGTNGPDLDAAFLAARERGMDQDTIEGVVQSQIENPRPAPADQPNVYMPANLVTGADLENVAAYVGSVAGIPGIEPPIAPGGPGGQVFANNGCGGCHTLEAAGTTGNAGPNLDQVIPGESPAQVEESIVDPGAEIAAGFSNAMPPNYGTLIVPEDLELLIEFLTNCAGDPTAEDCS